MSHLIEPIKDINFDDSQIFGNLLTQEQKKDQFVSYFKEILKLLDCVDCKKCKVYGKMQVLGMGVALRILMQKSGDLMRNEMVAFINTMNKWTQSVEIMYEMHELMQAEHNSQFLYITGLYVCMVVILVRIMWYLKEEKEKELKNK